MSDSKPIKISGPNHPITIAPTKGRVTVERAYYSISAGGERSVNAILEPRAILET